MAGRFTRIQRRTTTRFGRVCECEAGPVVKHSRRGVAGHGVDAVGKHLKSGVFWFVVYRKTSRRHMASCEMDSGHWALRSLSFPGPFKSSCLVRTL